MKKLPLFAACFLVLLFCLTSFGQDDSGFYQTDVLKSDYKQVDAVASVKVNKIRIVDSMDGDCENNKGGGYCLYELTADVKEVFKGQISGKTLKFYTSPDADYPKAKLLGEQVVFLQKSELKLNKTKQFFTMENSTRRLKFDIAGKLRKIKRSVR